MNRMPNDKVKLDELRAEFQAQHFGGIPWWLPAWQRAAILYNTTRHARTAKLTVAWDRLKSDGPLRAGYFFRIVIRRSRDLLSTAMEWECPPSRHFTNSTSPDFKTLSSA